MWLLIAMIITEILSPVVLWQYPRQLKGKKFFFLVLVHFTLSLWLWVLFITTSLNRTFFDDPQHIWLLMNFRGMMIAVVAPRVILILFHFTGKLIRLRQGGDIRWLTGTGFVIAGIIFVIIAFGTLYGRFNFRTNEVTLRIKGLHKDLDGLRIVQMSDMHLAGFHHHKKVLISVIERINSYKPDIILNTGDFISYGWREFDGCDTILKKAKCRYGNFAIMGNHDFGGYNPDFTVADRENNVLIMNNLIRASGYRVLNDENTVIRIGSAKIGLIGVTTMGRYPDIIHGDLQKATAGLDSADFRILLSHDPNHWEKAVKEKTDINLTLSGHTHGMQMGIMTEKVKWSPSKWFYPHWAGLFSYKDQFQYVNVGLGVLTIPFRIWMPPEITVITLSKD
jgi:uncharacterized protein